MKVIEPGADGKYDIRVPARLGGRIVAPHSSNTEVELVIERQRALAHERGVDRNIQLLGQRSQFLVGTRHPYAATRQDQWSL